VVTVASSSRERLAPHVRRNQLIDLGLQLLGDRPLDQIPVDEIARRAGISRGLLFHYFGSKRGFLTEVVRRAAAELLRATQPDPTEDPFDQLHHGLLAYVKYVQANRTGYLSLVRGAAGADPALAEIFEATRQSLVDRVLAGLGDARPSPTLRVAVRGWVAMVEEATVTWLDHQPISRKALVELLEHALAALIE